MGGSVALANSPEQAISSKATINESPFNFGITRDLSYSERRIIA